MTLLTLEVMLFFYQCMHQHVQCAPATDLNIKHVMSKIENTKIEQATSPSEM